MRIAAFGDIHSNHIALRACLDAVDTFPDKLKRSVLSQDGIWNLLERNRELTRKLRISEVQGHDEYE